MALSLWHLTWHVRGKCRRSTHDRNRSICYTLFILLCRQGYLSSRIIDGAGAFCFLNCLGVLLNQRWQARENAL